MKRFLCVPLFLLLATSVSASTITATSYDGPIPGNLTMVTGVEDFNLGAEAFEPGTWQITYLGGYTAWRDVTTIYAEDIAGFTLLIPPGPLTVGAAFTFTAPRPWFLTAQTPSLDATATTSWSMPLTPTSQWAFWTQNNTLHWALEDISVWQGIGEYVSDRDYQDDYGTMVHLTPTLQQTPPTETPEPVGLGLFGLLALGIAGRIRKGLK